MASIYPRNGRLWCRLKGLKVKGRWGSARTPYLVGEEDKASRFVDEAQRALDEKHERGSSATSEMTVRAYAKPWIEHRRKLDLDWKTDESRLRVHVLPVIGDMPIGAVRSRNVVELFRQLREQKPPIAQRTIYNIYSVVAALFRDAKRADLIGQTPCDLDATVLGPLTDKDPEWRAQAIFTRAEAETIIAHPAIPPDRQIVYGLELLAGVRPGEASALRWRHYDAMKQPLGEMLVALAYNTRKNRQKSTKTSSVRHVPVHQTLAVMLAEWRDVGWAKMMGRAPEANDLIVPLPPHAAARRRSRNGGEPFRGHDYSGKRWREQDLPALGFDRHRRHYDMRATFITLALEDGADPHVIETRVTHTKKSRSAFSGYNRGLQWAITCAEVAKLDVTRRLATPLLHAIARPGDNKGQSVEAAGVEGTESSIYDRVDLATMEKDMTVANQSELSRTIRVASLATALAAAVLAGDELNARRFAREIRDLDPERVRQAAAAAERCGE